MGPQMLVEQHMLNAAEEQALIAELSFRPEDRWLQLLYRCATQGVQGLGAPQHWGVMKDLDGYCSLSMECAGCRVQSRILAKCAPIEFFHLVPRC